MGNVLSSTEMISCKLLNQLAQKWLAPHDQGKRGSEIKLEKEIEKIVPHKKLRLSFPFCVQVLVESRKAKGSLSSLKCYCDSRGLLVARSKPGFKHVMLLLSVKAVQLVQVSSQLEHPWCLGIIPLLTIISCNFKVTIPIILSWDRCTMTFMKGCMTNVKSDYTFCAYMKSYCNYA